MPTLPVLQNVDLTSDRLVAEFEALAPGQVRWGRHDRMLYATDASIYQVEPLGVVIPRDIDTLLRVVAFCGRERIPILPRGGGTSLPGQCTNRAVVVDHSAYCRNILSVDPAGRRCCVEPGRTLDELNRELRQRAPGLFYAPDPATSAQATVGGCIGNNAAGARSIRYGRTSENVAGVDVILSTGERVWLEPGAGRHSAVAANLATRVAALTRQHATAIRARFPKTIRRNAGYGLDLILQQIDRGVADEDLDLSGLICGSEGTLAVVVAARLKLHPIPALRGLALASFAGVTEAIDAVVDILATKPSAVELLDDAVLEAARGNAECRNYLELLADLPDGPPRAVLYVEYETADVPELEAEFDRLRQVLGPAARLKTYHDAAALAHAWALRKAGEPLLCGLSGTRKPLTCVEDNAIPVENLARFVRDFRAIVARHGTIAAYFAHASVGVLHVRPMLDLHDPADQERMREIAVEVADLARDCGGVMSGEHGDGRIRGPLLERFYGPEIMQAFAALKGIFDPAGVLNPGNIVDAGSLASLTETLRVKPAERPAVVPAVDTFYDYASQEGFGGAVEMCNGAGVCRRTLVGSMCPSYRALRDERHATRGRANALRLAITGQIGKGSAAAGSSPSAPAWDDPETVETLDLCLSCKACKSECPSNVDIAKLKAEYTAQRYRVTGRVPLKARAFGHIRRLNRLGAVTPRLANRVGQWAPVRAILNRVLGLAPRRSLPAFAPSLFSWYARHERPNIGAPKIVLFADCFVTYNEPEIGQDAVLLLEKLGYDVLLPKVGCCGRSMISNGLLPDAIRAADAVLAALKRHVEDPSVRAIVVCEPSCLSAIKDDYLELKTHAPHAEARALAAKSFLVEEFIDAQWDQHPRPATLAVPAAGPPVLLHGHCHQKSLWGQSSAPLLKRLLGPRLIVLDSGCCGMAGGFGYTQNHYDLSMKIGEQSLFGQLRNVPDDAIIVTPGTSCRHQIHDGTQRPAIHPITLAARLIQNGS